jgi:hypothetical protein
MTRGVATMVVTVVPDSGTGGLAGLSGRFTITISEGKHFYELEYMIGAAPEDTVRVTKPTDRDIEVAGSGPPPGRGSGG